MTSPDDKSPMKHDAEDEGLGLPQWCYLALLRLLPKPLRDDGRDELLQIFREQWAATPLRSRPTLVLILVVDTLRTAAWGWSRELAITPRPRPKASRLEILMQDITRAFRSLAKSPTFTIIALVVLSLGIGANATILTLADALFVADPPHVEEPDRLVRLMRTSESGDEGALAYPDFQHYRENNEVFEELAAYDNGAFAVTVGHDGDRISGSGWFVTDNYFSTLGALPQEGRFFLPEENETPGTHPVVVLSDALWRSAFDSDPRVLGSTVSLNGNPFQVIGVGPRGFRGISPLETPPDLWVPIVSQPTLEPTAANYTLERIPGARWVWLRGVGRLRDDVAFEAAEANVDAMANYLAENFADWSEGWGAALTEHVGFRPSDRSGLISVVRLLQGALTLLLLIVAANVAILMLVRGSERARETGVRLALGASRARVARQVLAETLVLASAAGLLSFGIARVCADLAAAWMPMSFGLQFSPSLRVLLGSLVLSAVVASLASLAPIVQCFRQSPESLLRKRSGEHGRPWVRGTLVVVQVALSLVLVVGATLFGRSVATARAVDLGFTTEDRLVLSVNLRNHGYSEEQGLQFTERALEQLGALPGVESVTTTMMVPFRGAAMTGIQPFGAGGTGGEDQFGGAIEGTADDGANAGQTTSGFNVVGPRYFETMGMPIVQGRGIEPTDRAGATQVVVVNETLAARFWPAGQAVGEQVQLGPGDPPLTVVGVAANATYYELGEEPAAQYWVPALQEYSARVNFVIASRGGMGPLADRARETLLSLDPDLAVPAPSTLDEAFFAEIARYRTAARLVSLFGALALVLASVGLYGTLSYLVVQRRREIGIRYALGASGRRIAAAVIGSALRLTAIGVAVGLVGAFLSVRFVVSFLYGVEPTDAMTFLAAPLGLLLVAFLASFIPARRASKVDPMRAIRTD